MSEFICFNAYDGFLFNQTGKNLIAKFESIQRVIKYDSYFIVSKRIEFNLSNRQKFKILYGVFDAKNKTYLIECIYNEIKSIYDTDKFIVKLNKNEGVVDVRGDVIVPIKYDKVSIGIEDGMFICDKRSKCELFYTVSGKTIKLKFQEVVLDNRKSKFIVRLGLKWGICDSSLNEIIPPSFSDFMGQDEEHLVFLKNNRLIVILNNEIILEVPAEKFCYLKNGILVTKFKENFIFRNLHKGKKFEYEIDFLEYSQIYDCFVYGVLIRDYRNVNTNRFGNELLYYGIITNDLTRIKEVKLPDFLPTTVDTTVFYLKYATRFTSKNIIDLQCVDLELAVMTTEEKNAQVYSLVNSKGEYIIKEFESFIWDDEEFENGNEISSPLSNDSRYELEDEGSASDNWELENELEEDYYEDGIDSSESSASYSQDAVESEYSAGVKNKTGGDAIVETSNREMYLWLIVAAVFVLLFLTKPTFSDFSNYAKRDWASQFYEIGKQSDDKFVSACTRLVELSGVLSEAEDELWSNNCIDCLTFKNYGIFVIAKVDMTGYYKTYVGVFGSFYEL
jgi:hypothetical protein